MSAPLHMYTMSSSSVSSGTLSDAPLSNFKPPPIEPLRIVRTPSPTPSEVKVLNDDGKRHFDKFKRENWKSLLITIFFIILLILMAVFHDQIVEALEPFAKWMYETPGGWLIPIAILIILSVPPLFGHEIIVVLIGLTWGLGAGFAIAAVGSILGELGTYFLCKYWLRDHGKKYEGKNIEYALLARNIRDGGLKMAIVARYSIIPGHLLTAIFTACGMSLKTFMISALVSLPKQCVGVYLGYALRETSDEQNKKSKITNWIFIGVTVLVTVLTANYMRKKQHAVREAVVYERRKNRQAKMHQPTPLPTAFPPSYLQDIEQGPIHTPQPAWVLGQVEPDIPLARTHTVNSSRDELIAHRL